jgi:tRNA(Ile)-lysidine synthase
MGRSAGARGAPRDAALPATLAPWTARLPLLAELAAAGDPVVVACSGGADSLALLALSVAAGVAAVAVHVDHGLRVGSHADFAVVEAAARELGVAARVVRVVVPPGSNLEARAREARYGALDDARLASGASAVLVGHTADDQAETVLLNLLRGAATAGLAAMAVRQGAVVRPLLGLRRRDTLEICARLAFAPVVDPMNGDPHFRRVWLRREVLPALEAGAGRDLRALLARQAEVMREESDLLETLARRALDDAGDPPRAAAIAALEPALARRALRQWLGGTPPSLAAVDGVLAVATGARRAVELPGDRRVARRRGRLVMENGPAPASLAAAPPEVAHPFAVPGPVAAGGVELETWVERAAPVVWPDGRETCVVDADRVGDRVWLRPAERGERFVPLGMRGTKTVSAAWAESPGGATAVAGAAPAGGPRVVATGASNGVVWVVGYRIDDRVRITSRTRRFLWMTVSARALSR